MKIPKYVQELMARSYYYFYDFGILDKCYAAGYTIAIEKATPYTRASTLKAEVERLKKWVERQPGGECCIISCPRKTKYSDQAAIVTIFDPVMQYIEKYIPD